MEKVIERETAPLSPVIARYGKRLPFAGALIHIFDALELFAALVLKLELVFLVAVLAGDIDHIRPGM